MSTLTVKEQISNALSVDVTDDTLLVELDDGRTISVPTAWYPIYSGDTILNYCNSSNSLLIFPFRLIF